jgi:hypothetical protein
MKKKALNRFNALEVDDAAYELCCVLESILDDIELPYLSRLSKASAFMLYARMVMCYEVRKHV